MKNNIVNRWNPPGKRFLYLAYASEKNAKIGDVTENEYTCLEEMRALTGEDYSFADFKPKKSLPQRTILNLDYEGIAQDGIQIAYDHLVHEIAMKDAAKLLPLLSIGMLPSKQAIAGMSKTQIGQISAGRIGEGLLRLLCQTIFVPVDDDVSSPDQREVAYKSFHALADYLEYKRINGIIYPSTRTKLVGKHTQNIVLFYADDFEPIQNSFRKIRKK